MWLYPSLNKCLPTRPAPFAPKRVVLILPCCIGDVVMATPVLRALRRAYPTAHLTWAVGGWARTVIERHPDLDAILDTGAAALPVKSWGGFWGFVGQLRAGEFDLAVSLVRSPLMSAAVALSGIPHRAGLDSAGRGFGYTVRATIDPATERHESEIYLDVPRALGIDVSGLWASVPVQPDSQAAARAVLDGLGVKPPFLLMNPAGGSNPGMIFDAKRYPPPMFATLADGLVRALDLPLVLIGASSDAPILEAVQRELPQRVPAVIGGLTLPQAAALAAEAALYVGNDTGLTHLAAASGAKTAMLMGPTSPRRYAPYTPDSLVLWKPTPIASGGVAAVNKDAAWDWARDGLLPQDAQSQILAWLQR